MSGLTTGQSVVLSDNGADPVTVSTNGTWTFSTALAANSNFAVTVTTQPTQETCSVAQATGSGLTANITTVAVTCAPDTVTVGGTVTGLATGQSVTLTNGTDTKTVAGSTAPVPFTFANPVNSAGGTYSVAVGTQPANETCTVSSGSGTTGTTNVTSVAVACAADTYTISGTVTGLVSGQQVTLYDNGGDAKIVAAGGTGTDSFTFATPVAYQGGYAVTVNTQPTNETCSVSGGTGTGSGVNANVTTVALTCSKDTYTIGGTVTGLASGQTLTIKDNGSDSKTITGTGSAVAYTFATSVPFQGSYAVTIGTQPTNETCSVSAGTGSGSGVNANVTTANLVCSAQTYTIGGTVTGLANGQILTLTNNGANPTTVTGATGSPAKTFTFSSAVPFQGSYAVAVSTNPTNQTCTISGATGSGSGVSANVTSVALTCSNDTYTIGGTVTGLASGQILTLSDNGGTGGNIATVTGTGSPVTFGFTTPVAYLGSYAVTVSTNPTNQTCSISGVTGTGSGVTANVSTVALTCSNDTYTIGGTVTGLRTGQSFSLVDNLGTGGNIAPITGTGSPVTFTFGQAVPYLGSYSVTVSGSGPANQTCSPNGTTNVGSAVAANIASVGFTCADDAYTIGGTVTGLASGETVTLIDNGGTGGNIATVTGGGTGTDTLAFGQTVPYLGGYSVAVGTQPTTGNHCTVVSTTASGSGVAANVTSVAVTCRPQLVYAVNQPGVGLAGSVSEFTINANGTLTALGSIAAGLQPQSIDVDPLGRYAYVANFGDGTISQYTIDATGVLHVNSVSATTSLGAGTQPFKVVVDGTGSYVYVVENGFGLVAQFKIQSDGTLLAIGTPQATGSSPFDITLDPTAGYAYVSNGNDGTLSQYVISSVDGTLTTNPISATVTVGTEPGSITFDPTGTYAYVANYGTSPAFADSSIQELSFGGLSATAAGGALTAGAATGTGIVTSPYKFVISPNGLYGYATDTSAGYISAFTFGAGGALSAPITTLTPTASLQSIAVDRSSMYVYATDLNGNLLQFTISTVDGSLVSNGLVPSPATVWVITTY